MCLLIGIELINEIVVIFGWLSNWLICLWLLWIIFSILVGVLVFMNNLVSNIGVCGFCLDGLSIKVLLYIIVSGNIYNGIIVGKLNGVMFR